MLNFHYHKVNLNLRNIQGLMLQALFTRNHWRKTFIMGE